MILGEAGERFLGKIWHLANGGQKSSNLFAISLGSSL